MKPDDLAAAALPPPTLHDDAALLDAALAALEPRLAAQVGAGRRGPAAPLSALVIGDDEVERLLAGGNPGPDYEAGSLLGPLLAAWQGGAPSRLTELAARFGLSAFELECLLVCAAPDIDRRFERVFGYLNDDVGLRYPSVDLLARLLAPRAERGHSAGLLARDGKLARFALLLPAADGRSASAAGQTLRVADGVLRFLLNQDGADAALLPLWCRPAESPLARVLWAQAGSAAQLTALLREHLAGTRRAPLLVALAGRPGSGRRHAAEEACRALAMPCLALDARALAKLPDAELRLTAALRDALLLGAPLYLADAQALADETAAWRPIFNRLIYELGWIVLAGVESADALAGWCPSARRVVLELPPLAGSERLAAWSTLLAATSLPADEHQALAEALATKFYLTAGELAQTMQQVLDAPQPPASAAAWWAALHAAAGDVAAPRLATLAQPVQPRVRLADVVLPEPQARLLADIVRRVRHRRRVMEDWAFDEQGARGRGLVALFCGPSGTGKTMAAEAIAHELGMRLYRVDLAGVVSKYIGETEKNLKTVLDEAERAHAVIFFDEADALFGKRSEVKDAHDRYANIEINYLLQRIECYSGVALLATNLRHHLDDAFLRRIHLTVEFALPKLPQRRLLWSRAFAAAPVDELDLDFIAARFEVNGGTIRNAALGAAYIAADDDAPIGMRQVLGALRQELIKSGRRAPAADFGRYADLLATD
jgi:AAA+ superfamily predicted ATPase